MRARGADVGGAGGGKQGKAPVPSLDKAADDFAAEVLTDLSGASGMQPQISDARKEATAGPATGDGGARRIGQQASSHSRFRTERRS
jgi:hypothetical protein